MKLTKTPLLLIIFTIIFNLFTTQIYAETQTLTCGESVIDNPIMQTSCECNESGIDGELNSFNRNGQNLLCCGWVVDDICHNNPNYFNPPEDITTGLTNETFDSLNPLKVSGSKVADDLSTPGGIVSRLLSFLFPLAGLALFALISWGGFEMLISATDQKGMEAGKNRVTAAIVGFILLFSSYWLAQIVEYVFKIKIL